MFPITSCSPSRQGISPGHCPALAKQHIIACQILDSLKTGGTLQEGWRKKTHKNLQWSWIRKSLRTGEHREVSQGLQKREPAGCPWVQLPRLPSQHRAPSSSIQDTTTAHQHVTDISGDLSIMGQESTLGWPRRDTRPFKPETMA